MRKFLSPAFACAFVLLAGFARAQQVDVAVGGSTLWSTKPTTASQAFLPPAEKGGVYPSASLQYLLKNKVKNKRVGFNAEGAFRYKEGLYNGYQRFRPVLYDLNAVYAPYFTDNARGDFMAGVGGETVIFYNQFVNCNAASGGCLTHANSTHFLVHFGGGVTYSLWRNLFVRPEAHYYFVRNNFEFHSDHVFRIGASVGFSFGSH